MTAREWLNVLAILDSIDEVPGMPWGDRDERVHMNVITARIEARQAEFRADPVRFLRRAGEPTRAAIWAEVERRLAGGA